MIETEILSQTTETGAALGNEIFEAIVIAVSDYFEEFAVPLEDGASDEEIATATASIRETVLELVILILDTDVEGPSVQVQAYKKKITPVDEVVQEIVSMVTEQVAAYAEESGTMGSPEIDVAAVAESVTSELMEALGEDNMTKKEMQKQADKIAEIIASEYIDTEATEEGMSESPTAALIEMMTPSPTLPLSIMATPSPSTTATLSASAAATEPKVVQNIVNKAVDILYSYVLENEVTLPTLGTETISAISEDVLNQVQQTAGEDIVTEEYLEEQSENIARLIANDIIAVEVTEGGEPMDLSDESLSDIVSTITDITISMALGDGGN